MRYEELVAQAKQSIHEIQPKEVAAQPEALLLDVREDDEWRAGHIPNARHVSRGMLELAIEELAPDLATPIICHCGGGGRSALVAERLQRMGYSNVKSMAGGFKAWQKADLPVTT